MAKKNTHVPQSTRELYPIELRGVTYMMRAVKGYAGIVLAKELTSFGDVAKNTGAAAKKATSSAKSAKGKPAVVEVDSSSFVGMLDSIDKLIDSMFTKGDRTKVRARLLDADDDLDVEDLMDAFTELTEKSTGNPTM